MPQALRLLLHACLGLPSAVEAARTDENGHMMTGHGIPFVRTRFRTIAFHTLLFVSIFVTAAVQATDLPLGAALAGAPSGGNALAISSLEFMFGQAIGSTRSA